MSDTGLSCYVLTGLTRKITEQRRVVVLGFDIRRKLALVIAGTLPIGLILTLILYALFGSILATLAIPVACAAGWFVFLRQSKTGLQMTTWRTQLDTAKAQPNTFFMCNREFDPTTPSIRVLKVSTVPVTRDQKTNESDLVDEIFSS